METLKTYNTTVVEDLRKVRDLLNYYHDETEPYRRREQMIRDILNY